MATTLKHLTYNSTVGPGRITPLPDDLTQVTLYEVPSSTSAQISKVVCAGWHTSNFAPLNVDGIAFQIHYVTSADAAADTTTFRTLIHTFNIPFGNISGPLTKANVDLATQDLSRLVGMVMEAGSKIILIARASAAANGAVVNGGIALFGVEVGA